MNEKQKRVAKIYPNKIYRIFELFILSVQLIFYEILSMPFQ